MTPVDPDQTLEPGNIEKSLDRYAPDIYKLANITVKIPFNLDSSDIGPGEWKILYNIIAGAMNSYDGFVIIHGTDTLVYTAAALSYLFPQLEKPIIMTGSQRPLSVLRTDARGNLIDSIELSTYDIPEVSICFGNKLFRGNRTKKTSIERFQSFESPNFPPLATVGLHVSINVQNYRKKKKDFGLAPIFDREIYSIKIFPGLNPQPFFTIFEKSAKAIILEGLGSGNLPALSGEWMEFISHMKANNTLVFIASQSAHGKVNLQLYESGRQAESAGAVSLGDMTVEAGLVKLMLLSANLNDPEKIEELMQKSLVGELTE